MNFLRRLFGLGEQPKRVELPPICDSVFGDLTWDSSYDWWEGRLVAPSGDEFEVTVEPSSDTEPHPNDGQRKAFQAVVPRLAELKLLAVRDYLPHFNEDGIVGAPYTETELSDQLVAGSIHIEADLEVKVSWVDTPNEILDGLALTASVSTEGETRFGWEG